MDHLIGQRFSLISKSEIRYVGTLHEINPEQSTISLEDVFSYGTEDRNPDNFIPPSQQKFDYIVFRGSDVKDIKVAEEQKENQQPSPISVPNDPAILNASRPGPPQGPPQDVRGQSPFPPPGYPPQPQFGQYPPPGQFGRGFGPPPGSFGPPGPQFYPPPPPPGYYPGPPGPPGPFPQGPRQYPPPPSMGPAGPRGRGSPGPQPTLPKQTSELPDNKPSLPKQPKVSQSTESQQAVVESSQPKAGPSIAKNTRVVPAVPFAVNQKSFTPPVVSDGSLGTTNGHKSSTANPTTQASMEDASRQAKAAVAEAMAKLNPQASQSKSIPSAESIDALSKKVSEVNTGRPQPQSQLRGRGGYRGGRGNRSTSGGQKKIEIPSADYDFESANAKFSKEDLIKEAIAAGSPVGETADSADVELEEQVPERKDSVNTAVPAYNKSRSFFDDISSEAKERGEAGDARANARTLRGQEFKKNIETFGQGNVDGNFRGGYRGRGRGRGYGRGYNRGYGRGRGRGGAEAPATQ